MRGPYWRADNVRASCVLAMILACWKGVGGGGWLRVCCLVLLL